MKFGDIIRDHRLKRGWSQADFIANVGGDFSRSYLTKIELHGELPSPEMIMKLAHKLGIDKEYIAGVARKEFIDNYREKLDRIYTEAMAKHGRTWKSPRESEEGEGVVQLDSVHSEGV